MSSSDRYVEPTYVAAGQLFFQSIRSMKTTYERLQETGRIDPEQAASFILNSPNGLVRGIDERIDGLRLAWSKVVEGYAAHLNRTLPSPKTSRRARETK